MAEAIIEEFSKKFPEAIEVLQEGLEDSLQFYHFPQIDNMEYTKDWKIERSYIKPDKLHEVMKIYEAQLKVA